MGGGAGDDRYSDNMGENLYKYVSTNEGRDVINNFFGSDNAVDISKLLNAADKGAEDVQLSSSGKNTVLTVDGLDDFSITFTNASVDDFTLGNSAISPDIIIS